MYSQSSVIALGTQQTHYHTLAKEIPLILYHFLVDTDLSSTIVAIHAHHLFIVTYLVIHPYVYFTFLLSLINAEKKKQSKQKAISPSHLYIFPLFLNIWINNFIWQVYTRAHTHTHTLVGQKVESMNEMWMAPLIIEWTSDRSNKRKYFILIFPVQLQRGIECGVHIIRLLDGLLYDNIDSANCLERARRYEDSGTKGRSFDAIRDAHI